MWRVVLCACALSCACVEVSPSCEPIDDRLQWDGVVGVWQGVGADEGLLLVFGGDGDFREWRRLDGEWRQWARGRYWLEAERLWVSARDAGDPGISETILRQDYERVDGYSLQRGHLKLWIEDDQGSGPEFVRVRCDWDTRPEWPEPPMMLHPGLGSERQQGLERAPELTLSVGSMYLEGERSAARIGG